MKPLALFLALWPSLVVAATRNYTAPLTADSCTNTDSNSSYSDLRLAKAAEWVAGDTINLNGGGTFVTDASTAGFIVNLANITIDGQGAATLSRSQGGASLLATVLCNTNGFTLQNCNVASSGSTTHSVMLDASSNSVLTGIVIRNVTVTAALDSAGGGLSPLACFTGTSGSVSSVWENVRAVFPTTNDMRDTFIYGDGTNVSTVLSRCFLKNCTFMGANHGTGDNVVSIDSNVDLLAEDCIFAYAGGYVVAQGNLANRGRLYLNRCEIAYPGQASGGITTAVLAQDVRRCYIHHCLIGIQTDPGWTATAAASGMSIVDGCYIVRDPTLLIGASALRSTGIYQGVLGSNLIVRNTAIEGFTPCKPSDGTFNKYGRGMMLCNTNNQYATVDHVFVNGAYSGIEAGQYGTYGPGYVDLRNVTILGAEADPGGGPSPNGVYVAGVDSTHKIAMRMNNCMVNWNVTGGTGYGVSTSNVAQDVRGGYNYIYAGAGAAGQRTGWVLYGTDKTSPAAPILAANGAPNPGTDAGTWGFYDPDYASTNACARIQTFTVNTNTAATTLAFDVNANSNTGSQTWAYNTVLWADDATNGNAGRWFTVASDANTNGNHVRFTMIQTMPNIPLAGDKGILIPPSWPSCGLATEFYQEHVAFESGLGVEPFDPFSRKTPMEFYAGGGATAVGRTRVGWMGYPSAQVAGRPTADRPSFGRFTAAAAAWNRSYLDRYR